MHREVSQDINEYYAKMGLVYRSEIGAVIAVATTGTYFVGVQASPSRIRVLSRSYSSSESPLTIELFEATFTGGTPVRTLNANQNVGGTSPAPMFGGVTPGSLTTVITGLTLRAPTAGGTAQVSVNADDSVLILKENQPYVIRFTNGGGVNANIGAVINLRAMQPEE